ncbi:MAG: preprotein translocase subunit SecA [Planctomycetota bacterium]
MSRSDIPVIGPLVNALFGNRNERFVKRYTSLVESVNALEPEIRALTDAQLRAKTEEFRERAEGGEPTRKLMVEAFAVAREAMDRHVGIRSAFDPELREQFPKDQLPDSARAIYEQLCSEMDAAEPREPKDDLLGCTEPQPGWVWTDIPTDFYDAVREVLPKSKPPFRARPFDVQLIGASVLYEGKISEMKTGEGKTIVAPLASYLAALDLHKVHVVTVNDYLVQRDRDWTFPFFHGLGLTVGAIHPMHMQDEGVKRLMYRCDVVYGTTSEFGFDYLRDNMKRSLDQQVQRLRDYAIVDEVDSVLIDEARTPLIISGPAHQDQPRYQLADELARHLVDLNKPWMAADEKVEDCKKAIKGAEGDIRNARDKSQIPALQQKLDEHKKRLPELEMARDQHTQYFEVERDKKQVHPTHEGTEAAQKKAGLGSFYVGENTDLPHLLGQAIRAHVVYEKDKDYIVVPVPDPQTGQNDPGIVIVDQNTGRAMPGRQWSEGLHQAVEAKEGVRVKQETQTVASVTVQNFFKMYKRLAGMTGTADTEAQEFHDIYKLDVVVIPTNVPVIRADHDDTIYLTQKDKWDAVVEEIAAFHDMGRPVLVGTTSVEKSEMLSKMLKQKHGIEHAVLNAKQHEREANVVQDAGKLGAVMIATNMAGRGTDIKLQKITREEHRDHLLRRGVAPRELDVNDDDETLRAKCFRKIAPKALDINKRDAESMDPDELELMLLRHWAEHHTWMDPKRIDSADAETLRKALDDTGRFGLHRLRWSDSAEDLGGLHVIGTERHESRRIDNQLRGRSGRQGDNGSTRFFVSLDDDLMKMFAGETTMKILSRMGMKEGDAIEHPMLSKSIVRAQRKVEERNFQIRKNILEYDEVMEHQRQDFYGLRQRAIDGRDIKGLIFEFVEDSVRDACAKYLAPDYFADRIGAFAGERLGCSIDTARLRRREPDEVIDMVRAQAKEDVRTEVDVTTGEYFPDIEEGESEADIDTKGMMSWAQTRFGVELTSQDIYETPIVQLKSRLIDAAEDRIDEADLTGIDEFLDPDFGRAQLAKWIKTTTDLDVTVEEIATAQESENTDPADVILDKVRAAYDTREVNYPVEFAMNLTMQLMRVNPQQAGGQLVNWAKTRYGIDWDENILRTKMPQQISDELLKASRAFVEDGRLEKAIDEALAADTSWDDLVAHFRDTYNAELPHWLKRMDGEEREGAIRARVENILRAELVQFERYVLLDTLDQAWHDHLYAMDQLRETIGFRAFSQQDPRIEYKREGARLIGEMWEKVRDRVSESVFRLRLTPQVGPPQRPQQRPPQAPPAAPAGAGAGGNQGGFNVGGGTFA